MGRAYAAGSMFLKGHLTLYIIAKETLVGEVSYGFVALASQPYGHFYSTRSYMVDDPEDVSY